MSQFFSLPPAASHRKNLRLEGVFRLFGRETEKLGSKVSRIIDEYRGTRDGMEKYRKLADKYAGLVEPMGKEVSKASKHTTLHSRRPDRKGFLVVL